MHDLDTIRVRNHDASLIPRKGDTILVRGPYHAGCFEHAAIVTKTRTQKLVGATLLPHGCDPYAIPDEIEFFITKADAEAYLATLAEPCKVNVAYWPASRTGDWK